MASSRETIGERSRTHGMTNTRLYGIWCGIKGRCNNPNIEHFPRYGGRGIKVCDEWNNSFSAFYEWALSSGYDPACSGREQSIDRIDCNGDYSPRNCRWVSMKEQARNRTDTVYVFADGKRTPAREFAEKHGIDYAYVFRKAKKNIPAETILADWNFAKNVPADYMDMHEATRHFHVTDMTIRAWLKCGKIQGEKHGQKWYILK